MQNITNSMIDLATLAQTLGLSVEELTAKVEAAKPDRAALKREAETLFKQHGEAFLAFAKAEKVYQEAAKTMADAAKRYEQVASALRAEGETVADLPKRLTEKAKVEALKAAAEKEAPKEEQKAEAPKEEKEVGKAKVNTRRPA